MDSLTPEDIVKMHVQKFGVKPKITGINFHESLDVYDKILEAIENGKPYTEPDVPDDCDI